MPGDSRAAETNAPTGKGSNKKGKGQADTVPLPSSPSGVTDGYRAFMLRVEANADPRAEIYRLAVDRRWTLRELARRRATLEDVFVEITHAE